MGQAFFTSITLNASAQAPINVQVGFQPAYIQLLNLSQIQSPIATNGYKAIWQQGMVQPSAITTVFGASSTFYDTTSYITTGGISLLNPLGSEVGQYGAVVSGFTNAASGVITVDSTYAAGITAGCIILVAALADSQVGPTLNGSYYVTSVTPTTITLGALPAGNPYSGYPAVQSANTALSGVYVSGGFVTLLQTASAITPFPLYTAYSNVPQWYNEAIQGFTIGIYTFANATYSATAGDVILVSCWDTMQP